MIIVMNNIDIKTCSWSGSEFDEGLLKTEEGKQRDEGDLLKNSTF
jgi:hypothetical protein